MENAPLTVDDDSETDYITRKKDTKKFGFMALERQSNSDDKKEKSFFSKLAEQEEIKKAEKRAKKDADQDNENENAPEFKAPSPEAEPVTELQAPLEKPSKTETAEVIQPKLVEVIEELEADKEPDPISDPPVNKFRELVKTGEDPEQALNEVLTELGAEDEIQEKVETEIETQPESTEAIIQDFEEDDVMVDLGDESEPEVTPASEPESTPESVYESELSEDTETPTTSNPPSGGSTVPPQPPFGFSPNGPNTLNTPPINPIIPSESKQHQPEYSQASPAAMALFGGIIGYLIGRRSGRIKTEKKLLPVQKKLENEVENLQFELQEKEKKIRRVAAQKVQQAGPAVIEVFNKVPVKPEHENSEDRQKAPEAQLLHGPKKAHEHIGKVIVTAESKPAEKYVKNINPEQLRPHLSEERIHTLNRAELLAMSEKIHVGDSSLRKIFETNLVGEKGLRRLISLYMRGGDINKALQNEIVEHEIDFERDPAMRDIAAASAPIQGNSSTTLSDMLKEATQKVAGHDPEQAHYRQPKVSESDNLQSNHQDNRQLLDYAFITIILILLSAVIYLAFFR